MTKDFLFEPFTDGVEINEVDFMQRHQIFDFGTEFSELFREKCCGSGDGDINIRMGTGCTFRPRTKPDDLSVTAQGASSKLRDFLCNLSRASDKFLRNHMASVSVLVMMSTGVLRQTD